METKILIHHVFQFENHSIAFQHGERLLDVALVRDGQLLLFGGHVRGSDYLNTSGKYRRHRKSPFPNGKRLIIESRVLAFIAPVSKFMIAYGLTTSNNFSCDI